MLERIQLLRNVGQFDNVSPPPGTELTKFTVLFAENGRGKTTLAAILRSIWNNDPTLINERRRLGARHPPHIVFRCGGECIRFEDGAWTQSIPHIDIFDDEFVAANVCSGIEVQREHQKNLHELVLGAPGVNLSKALRAYIEQNEVHNSKLRNLSDLIKRHMHAHDNVNDFCNLSQIPNIEAEIENTENLLAAAKSVDAIHQRENFQDITLPKFNIVDLNSILARNLAELESKAFEHVRDHISSLGNDGEVWVAHGMKIMNSKPQGEGYGACPFCAQNLDGSGIIRYYQIYFSEEYERLKDAIRETVDGVIALHGDAKQAEFERNIRISIETHTFWRNFVKLPVIEFDTTEITSVWQTARDAILVRLGEKEAAPFEQMELSQEAQRAIQLYSKRANSFSTQYAQLVAANAELDALRNKIDIGKVASIEKDLNNLKSVRARFFPEVASLCDEYLREKERKICTESLRDVARTELSQFRNTVFGKYMDTINHYLYEFGSSFQLRNFRPTNNRQGSSAHYCIEINQQDVNLRTESGPSFRNTLSSGDRNTLALAFFFASIDSGQNIGSKIVVFDDPMSSLDEHRAFLTSAKIIALSNRVKQIIVLSHSRPFLCDLWERANPRTRTALKLLQRANSSEIAIWDVTDDSVTEHDKLHELVRSYIRCADPSKRRNVATALRLVLEKFLRVAYPEHFPPGQLIGRFIAICRDRLGQFDQILDAIDIEELRILNDYANQFHHSGRPPNNINDGELGNFARRTLLFTSRR